MATGFVSTNAFAENTEEGNVPPAGEQAKPEGPAAAVAADAAQPAAIPAPPAAVVTAPAAAAPVIAKPSVGDLSVHGYLRAGFGGSSQKGRMTCFGLSTSISGGLISKYRLGNECEQWGELHFTAVAYSGDDGVIGTFHFSPVAYIPTGDIGYSPNSTISTPDIYKSSTGATVSFPNLYADLQGISWLYGGTAWAGSRYYKRESIYISDFFYWNPSGMGAGIEDAFRIGKMAPSAPDIVKDMAFSLGFFAVDGEPQNPPPDAVDAKWTMAPQLPGKYAFGVRSDFQIRGFRPYSSGEIQVGFQYIADWSHSKDDYGRDASTSGGWGVTARYIHNMLGGDNKFVVQYGQGGGTGFGTLGRFYYPDFSLQHSPVQTRWRVLDVLTIQPTRWLGLQANVVYQRDDLGSGSSGAVTNWYSSGLRLTFGVLDHLKLIYEAGSDLVEKTNGAPKIWLVKNTGAIAISAARGFWARPEIRLFFTGASWSDEARTPGVDSSRLYTDKYTTYIRGFSFGLQTEVMW
jgi:maltoporin